MEPLKDICHVLPQFLPQLRFGLHDVEGADDSRRLLGGEAGGETVAGGAGFQECDGLLSGGDEPPHCPQGFAQGAHVQLHPLFHRKMFRHPTPVAAEDSGAVSVVHHDGGAMFFGKFDDLRQWRQVAVHAEDAVGDDHFVVGRALFQFSLQMLHVAVAVFYHIGMGEADSHLDAAVV